MYIEKKYKIIMIVLLILSIVTPVKCNKQIIDRSNYDNKKETKIKRSPVPIFYGLNESHSNDWAQVNENGEIGVVYFEHDNNNSPEGVLCYKTIYTDGTENIEQIISGNRLEISVLLYDEQSKPHVFYSSSNDENQIIYHCYKNSLDEWEIDNILDFEGEGGKFIYELSAEISSVDGSFHLVILKTRSNPDSGDYMNAFIDSHLYHFSNVLGNWEKELIKTYHTLMTLDEYSKMNNRQDIAVDSDGNVHVIFGEQTSTSMQGSPSELYYTTNKTGNWIFELANDYNLNTRDDPGWYSSLSLDNNGNPHISCTYISRVSTGSAMSATLNFLSRTDDGNWNSEIVCEYDDGYYGGDGRDYTGGITHLVYDNDNSPHIIFSDIASSHAGMNYFNLGNIRYACKYSENWEIRKIYSQDLPNGNYNATEIYDMCLLFSNTTGKLQIIGQELNVLTPNDYVIEMISMIIEGNEITNNYDSRIMNYELKQNYPNPFNPTTEIYYELGITNFKLAEIIIHNSVGQKIWSSGNLPFTIHHSPLYFDGSKFNSGIYYYSLIIDGKKMDTKSMVLIK